MTDGQSGSASLGSRRPRVAELPPSVGAAVLAREPSPLLKRFTGEHGRELNTDAA